MDPEIFDDAADYLLTLAEEDCLIGACTAILSVTTCQDRRFDHHRDFFHDLFQDDAKEAKLGMHGYFWDRGPLIENLEARVIALLLCAEVARTTL